MRNATPILFLVFVTPCVEFLTGSSSVIAAVTVPSAAFTFFLLTWPSYAFPVLLIREALVEWRKGLSSLLALGISYGALNEGLLAKTYFVVNPTSPSLGGGVGHWLGVNWPWVTGITLFHMLVSISVPVVLSFLIFPESRQRRLLSDRAVRWCVVPILVEVLGILTIQSIFSPTVRALLPVILIPTGILLFGVWLARRLPVPDSTRVLTGRFARATYLVPTGVGFFILTFVPILSFFPLPFVPDGSLSAWFFQLGPSAGVIATVYPLGFAYLAMRFFSHYSLSDRQLLALVTGVMLVPLTNALAVHDVLQGDWAAAFVYIGAIVVALRRIRAAETTPRAPKPNVSRTSSPTLIEKADESPAG